MIICQSLTNTKQASVGIADRFVGVCIYSHRLGFMQRPFRQREFVATTASTPSHTSYLYHCQQAIKRFFEHLLSIPESNYWEFTMVQWASIVISVINASRLTFVMAAEKKWDPDTTRQSIPLGMYLDCFCYRLGTLSSYDESNTNEQQPDAMFILKKLLGNVKQSYERRVSKIGPQNFVSNDGTAVDDIKTRCPMFDPGMSHYLERQSETLSMWGPSPAGTSSGVSESSNASSSLRYHDLWATMTGTWAEET